MTETPFDIDVSGREHLEEWRSIPEWEGYYEASNLGRIRGIDRHVPVKGGRTAFIRGRILGQRIIDNGYLVVMMCKNNQYQNQLVHRLVLKAFVGLPLPQQQCRHLNGVRTDNRPENLRWGSVSENTIDQVNHGTHRSVRKTECDYGHAFTSANTIIRKSGARNCRECKRIKDAAYYAANKDRLDSWKWTPEKAEARRQRKQGGTSKDAQVA